MGCLEPIHINAEVHVSSIFENSSILRASRGRVVGLDLNDGMSQELFNDGWVNNSPWTFVHNVYGATTVFTGDVWSIIWPTQADLIAVNHIQPIDLYIHTETPVYPLGHQGKWWGSFDVYIPGETEWILDTHKYNDSGNIYFLTGNKTVHWEIYMELAVPYYRFLYSRIMFDGTWMPGPVPTAGNGDYHMYFSIDTPELHFFNPTNVIAEPLDKMLGDTVNWLEGVSATWGLTTSKLVNDHGEILDISLVGGTDPAVSTTGLTFDRIGTVVHTYEFRDSMALGTHGFEIYDNTVTVDSRKINVRTSITPHIAIRYSAGAEDPDGNSVAGLTYDASQPITASGGENGWTNQPLDISVDPNSIQGTFDTILKIPSLPNVVTTNGTATYLGYHDETLDIGITASGVLAEIENTMTPEIENDNHLSGIVQGSWKLDKTPPVAGATHDGGWTFTDTSTDGLSGLSVTRPSLIAIVPTGNTPVSTNYKPFSDITPLPPGNYDVYVKATDKAGNEHINMIFTDYSLSGGVTIEKDTNEGATLHVNDCPAPNNKLTTIDAACTILGCSLGAKADITERSELTYELTIVNADDNEIGTGTFTDYLPKGCVITAPPSFVGSDPMDDVTFVYGAPEPSGPYEGQIKVTGTYTIKAGSTIDIAIPCKVPSFDKDPGATNIISNQASLEWTLGTGGTATNGTYESKFANHRLLELPGVETKFKKVGSDDVNIGLIGAEFVLYKWTGTDVEYTGGNHDQDIVDKEVLLDGKWQRVKEDGEDAVALTDVFISDGSGDIDLGDLPSGIYTLIETKTVATYEIPVGQWILTVDEAKGDSGAVGDWQIEFVGKSNSIMPPAVARVGGGGGVAPEYKILNAKPFSIGLTGLGGTTRFLIIGLSLMTFAGATFIIRSHKKRAISRTN